MAVARKARIASSRELGPLTRLLDLELPPGETMGFTGGQYIIVNTLVPLPGDKVAKRAYSLLSSDAEQARVRVAVRRIGQGPGSNAMNDFPVGTEIAFSGPWGKYVPDGSSGRTLVLATDTGISAALGLVQSGKFVDALARTTLVWLVESGDYFLPESFVRERVPASCALLIERIGPVGDPARLEAARAVVARLAADGPFERVFLSGDGNVVHVLGDELLKTGLPEQAVRVEPFFNMRVRKAPSAGAPPPPARDPKGMRTGFTTGACAAAAAKAAARCLVRETTLERIETTLPNGDRVTFALKRCERHGSRATCSVVKDAGDDPDCTHQAELTAEVELRAEPGVEIRAGSGVATVTKPGLGLDVGVPAITAIPRRNLVDMVVEELLDSRWRGALVTLSVPRGEEMAKETINARLGLIGGISILGTSGIVKPYSTAAFRMSVVQAIDVARERGLGTCVLTTGGKSEAFAMKLLPQLAEDAFIQMGDFVGDALKHCARRGIARAVVVGMIGKLSKMADGKMQTHAAGSEVNMELLASLAGELGASDAIKAEIRAANTARHVLELCARSGLAGIASLICKRVVEHGTKHTSGKLAISAYLVDFEGALLGQHPSGEKPGEVLP